MTSEEKPTSQNTQGEKVAVNSLTALRNAKASCAVVVNQSLQDAMPTMRSRTMTAPFMSNIDTVRTSTLGTIKFGSSAKSRASTDSLYDPDSADSTTSSITPASPKRRKASLDVWSREGKKCKDAWNVPVKSIVTEGLRLKCEISEGNLPLCFDT